MQKTEIPAGLDPQLDYWCEVYLELRLHEENVELEAFLTDPAQTLEDLGYGHIDQPDTDYLPLLPAQAAIGYRLNWEWALESTTVRVGDPAPRAVLEVPETSARGPKLATV